MGTAFVSSAIFSWGNPYAITSSVLAAGFMDTPPGKKFSNFMGEDVFHDTLGLPSNIAYLLGDTISYSIVSSAFYIGLTTLAPQPSNGLDYTDPANHAEIGEYAKDVSAGQGGSSANYIQNEIEAGRDVTRISKWYPQGRVSSEVAYQDYPVLGKALKVAGIRHTAAVVKAGGRYLDSAADLPMFTPWKGQIPGLPWTGTCHQATVRALVAGGMTGWDAVRATASQAGWTYYVTSAVYGVEGHAGGVGLVDAVANRRLNR